jgi:very-short-patch-repair endonuclease
MLKARLADVIDVDNMHGLTSRAKYYSLSAHLDFVVIDKDTSRGRFAVELDGRQHVTDSKTIDRDKLKDELCSRADLPLLRIASDFARKIGRWRVLTYLTEAFYRCESWLQSQVSGYIPMDEPFFMGSAITPDEKGRLTFDALDSGVILDFHEHYESGKLPCRLPDVWVTDLPEIRAVQAHAWITVAPNRYLLAKTVVRRFRFRGISSGELAEQLAVVEIGDLAQRWIRNEAVAVEGRTIAKAVAEVQQ